jgi:hypothetical protein
MSIADECAAAPPRDPHGGAVGAVLGPCRRMLEVARGISDLAGLLLDRLRSLLTAASADFGEAVLAMDH